jgi:hypothetical protein
LPRAQKSSIQKSLIYKQKYWWTPASLLYCDNANLEWWGAWMPLQGSIRTQELRISLILLSGSPSRCLLWHLRNWQSVVLLKGDL